METNKKKLLNINASTCTIIVHAYPHMLQQKSHYSILYNYCTCISTHAPTEKSLFNIIQFKNISASWISNTPQLILNLNNRVHVDEM